MKKILGTLLAVLFSFMAIMMVLPKVPSYDSIKTVNLKSSSLPMYILSMATRPQI